MKVYLDKDKVKDKMFDSNIKTFRQLCELTGICDPQYLSHVFTHKVASPEISWLIADYFDCDIKDLWSVDWDRDARRADNGNNS